jgi:gas vesicle protein
MSDRGRGEFWAFMAGILAGGVAAMLYAPAKGEDTRRKIRETAEDAYHKGEEYYEKGITEAEKIYHEGRAKAEKIYEDGKHKVGEVVDAVQGKKTEPAPAKAEEK